MNGQYIVEMPDGTWWSVAIDVIADNRAKHYAYEYDGDHERALQEDTYPLFLSDHYEIHDWAANNMNWEDVKPWAKRVVDHMPPAVDYQDGWCNGKYRVVLQSQEISPKTPDHGA